MSGARLIQLAEYARLSYKELGPAGVSELERSIEKSGIPIFRFHRSELQAQSYVGFISTKEWLIQILPKITAETSLNLISLTSLLCYIGRVKVRATGKMDYSQCKGSLLEIWIRQFAEQLNELLRRDLRKEYITEVDEQSFVKGKLLVSKMLNGKWAHTGRFECRFDEFTADYKLNQLLKWVNRILLTQSHLPTTLALLRQNDALLAGIGNRPCSVQDVDAIHINRLNGHYQPLLDLSRLILSGSSLDFRAGRITQISLVFDMNQLFETFVAEFLCRNFRKLDLPDGSQVEKVKPQSHLGRLFDVFSMYADLAITFSSGKRVLLDTKYKLLSSDKTHLGLSIEDLYQMFGYSRGGTQEWNEIILVYPKSADQGKSLDRDYMRHGVRLKVRQIDLGAFIDLETGRIKRDGGLAEFRRVLA